MGNKDSAVFFSLLDVSTEKGRNGETRARIGHLAPAMVKVGGSRSKQGRGEGAGGLALQCARISAQGMFTGDPPRCSTYALQSLEAEGKVSLDLSSSEAGGP